MLMMQEIVEDYHEWLLDLMRIDLPEHRYYCKLLHDLDLKEFVWVLPMDENRDIDGLDLRREFFYENEIDSCEIWTSPRSCLEVLAAFSRRIEIEIMGEPGNDHIERWFWIMISNLGLDKFTDDNYDHEEVDHILDVWLSRKYKSNGKNGIFPLKKPTSDQRDVDIWYQMQNYLSENYPI